MRTTHNSTARPRANQTGALTWPKQVHTAISIFLITLPNSLADLFIIRKAIRPIRNPIFEDTMWWTTYIAGTTKCDPQILIGVPVV
jgi:hypothetical protein